MNILRRICAGIALALLAPLAAAQAYPNKPVRVIVPVPAGGTPDVVVRMVAPGLSHLLASNSLSITAAGRAGLIGAEFAAKAPPDGYTLLWSASGATDGTARAFAQACALRPIQ